MNESVKNFVVRLKVGKMELTETLTMRDHPHVTVTASLETEMWEATGKGVSVLASALL